MQRGKGSRRTGQVRGARDKPVYLRIVPYKTGCVDTPSSCINAWNAAPRYTGPPPPPSPSPLPSPRAEPRYRHRGVNRSNLSMDTRPIRYLSIRLDKRTACAEDNRFARNYAGICSNVCIYILLFSFQQFQCSSSEATTKLLEPIP